MGFFSNLLSGAKNVFKKGANLFNKAAPILKVGQKFLQGSNNKYLKGAGNLLGKVNTTADSIRKNPVLNAVNKVFNPPVPALDMSGLKAPPLPTRPTEVMQNLRTARPGTTILTKPGNTVVPTATVGRALDANGTGSTSGEKQRFFTRSRGGGR